MLRKLTLRDYDELLALWRSCEGVGLSEGDDREGVRLFLRRNPGLSFVARRSGRLVGAALCGHDGRRGFLYHVAVAPTKRRQGIAHSLIDACLKGLRAVGISKCHIVVFAKNKEGQRFWQHLGWVERKELKMMSQSLR